jgi:hypothetical protein
MPTLKRKNANGQWEYIQVSGLDVSQLKDEVDSVTTSLADLTSKKIDAVNLIKMGADNTGVLDCSALITSANKVYYFDGGTYKMSRQAVSKLNQYNVVGYGTIIINDFLQRTPDSVMVAPTDDTLQFGKINISDFKDPFWLSQNYPNEGESYVMFPKQKYNGSTQPPDTRTLTTGQAKTFNLWCGINQDVNLTSIPDTVTFYIGRFRAAVHLVQTNEWVVVEDAVPRDILLVDKDFNVGSTNLSRITLPTGTGNTNEVLKLTISKADLTGRGVHFGSNIISYNDYPAFDNVMGTLEVACDDINDGKFLVNIGCDIDIRDTTTGIDPNTWAFISKYERFNSRTIYVKQEKRTVYGHGLYNTDYRKIVPENSLDVFKNTTLIKKMDVQVMTMNNWASLNTKGFLLDENSSRLYAPKTLSKRNSSWGDIYALNPSTHLSVPYLSTTTYSPNGWVKLLEFPRLVGNERGAIEIDIISIGLNSLTRRKFYITFARQGWLSPVVISAGYNLTQQNGDIGTGSMLLYSTPRTEPDTVAGGHKVSLYMNYQGTNKHITIDVKVHSLFPFVKNYTVNKDLLNLYNNADVLWSNDQTEFTNKTLLTTIPLSGTT